MPALSAVEKSPKVESTNKEPKEKVLVGEEKAASISLLYIFTYKGSRERGVGMSLHHSSPIAREVWDRADRHLWTIMVPHFPWSFSSLY